jgi:hypothetical protein
VKSVTLSEIVRAHDPSRFLNPVQSWRQLASLALALAIGLPLIAALFHLLDPSAPLPFIVVPVVLGGLAPVFAVLPARFEVATRFQARHFIRTLDETLGTLGYVPVDNQRDTVCYRSQHPGWLRWKENEIRVTIREHAIEITGPIAPLRSLKRRIAC